MNPDGDDVGLLTKILGGLLGALSAAYWWMWNMTHKRIDGKAEAKEMDELVKRIEEHTISKGLFDEHTKSDDKALAAISVEMATQRGNIGKLFDKLEESNAETHVRFTKSDHDAHQRHIDLLNAIHAIKK
jgi:hypothetical protein